MKVECCGGRERFAGQCLRDRCPVYNKAKDTVNRKWPFIPTGFGNLYGWPCHDDILIFVAERRRRNV
jgi:hypothetical protein